MEINIQHKEVKPKTQGGVVIASNLKKQSERLDKDGNIIDPRTKQIIKLANEN